MRKNSFYIGTGMLGMWLFAACSQDGVPDNGASGSAEMRIYTDVARADGEETDAGSTADNPVFLFWDFGDVLGNAVDPTPLYVKRPKKHIDTYKRPNEPYNTGKLYPDGNRRVMATGYAPATLTPEKRTDNTYNYERLTIPQDGLCKTDVLTSITPVVASAALPFDREGGETLQFMHAQSKVIFKGKLAENMGKFIQNVNITLDNASIAERVEWDRKKNLYVPVAGENNSYTIKQQGGFQINDVEATDIGEAYIVPGQNSLSVTITVDRSEDVSFTQSETVTFSHTLNFEIERSEDSAWDAGKKENTLYANEAYTFTILFGEEGIELVGNKCPWENGGYLIVPIYPLGNQNQGGSGV